MNKREATFITNHVGPWMRTKGQMVKAITRKDVTFEAKETNTTIGDNDFEPQQLPSLRESASDTGLYVKIADGAGVASVFDGFFISDAYALVAIEYRGKGWCLIPVDKWDNKTTDRVDWEYAKLLADYWYI